MNENEKLKFSSSNDSNNILDEIDSINGIPIKTILSNDEQVNHQTEDDLNDKVIIKKKSSKNLFIILIVFLSVLVIGATITFVYLYQKNNQYEVLKTITLDSDEFPLYSQIKPKKIKEYKESNFIWIEYWSFGELEYQNYLKLLKDEGFYYGKKDKITYLIKRSNDEKDFLVVELIDGDKTIKYSKRKTSIKNFNLEIFTEDYQDYNLLSFGNDEIGYLSLPDTFTLLNDSNNSLYFEGELLKQVSYNLLDSSFSKDEYLSSKEAELKSLSFQKSDFKEEKQYYYLSAYNERLQLWNKIYLKEEENNLKEINYLSLTEKDYLDEIIISQLLEK